MFHQDGFLFLALSTSLNWNACTERLVAPSPDASCPPLSQFSSLRFLYRPYKSPRLISLYHLMCVLFVSQLPFPFQDWPDLELNQDSADHPGELLHPLTRSYFFLVPLGKLFLLAFPFLFETCLRSPWSPPFLLHAPALISLSLTKVRLSLTLTLSHLTIWYSGQTALFLFLLAKAALAYLPSAFWY